MLHLVLVEAALETVPLGILGHPSVRRNAKRRKKRTVETLLNRSLHHHAMERLKENLRRGRPDIANVCLTQQSSQLLPPEVFKPTRGKSPHIHYDFYATTAE